MQKRSIDSDIFGFTSIRDNINSKAKGNANERAAAKAMESWVGVKFVRTPQSGALRHDNTDKIVGDITPDTTDINFTFECIVETKALKSITINRFLKSNSALFTIWEQPMTDAARALKIPIAILRQKSMPAGEYYFILEASLGGSLMAMDTPVLFSGSNHKYSLIGFLFSDVKKHCPFKLWHRAVTKTGLISKSKLFV